jgi:hypothetical protein
MHFGSGFKGVRSVGLDHVAGNADRQTGTVSGMKRKRNSGKTEVQKQYRLLGIWGGIVQNQVCLGMFLVSSPTRCRPE